MTRTGVVAAMPEELAAVLDEIDAVRVEQLGGRRFHLGRLHGRPVVAVVSRIGKVAAAATTALLIERFGVGSIVFTGVAGAVAPHLRVGDVVIAERLMQHDLDVRPLFPRYEIPLLGVSEIDADPALTARAVAAARRFVEAELTTTVDDDTRTMFRLTGPAVHHGLIVSGDQFFASSAAIAELRDRLPDALAVEMEGAAVAQVCHELGVPFAVVRTISDAADDSAAHDFARFLTEVCAAYARALVRGILVSPPTAGGRCGGGRFDAASAGKV